MPYRSLSLSCKPSTACICMYRMYAVWWRLFVMLSCYTCVLQNFVPQKNHTAFAILIQAFKIPFFLSFTLLAAPFWLILRIYLTVRRVAAERTEVEKHQTKSMLPSGGLWCTCFKINYFLKVKHYLINKSKIGYSAKATINVLTRYVEILDVLILVYSYTILN